MHLYYRHEVTQYRRTSIIFITGASLLGEVNVIITSIAVTVNMAAYISKPNIERPVAAEMAKAGLNDRGSGPRGRFRPMRLVVFSL